MQSAMVDFASGAATLANSIKHACVVSDSCLFSALCKKHDVIHKTGSR